MPKIIVIEYIKGEVVAGVTYFSCFAVDVRFKIKGGGY